MQAQAKQAEPQLYVKYAFIYGLSGVVVLASTVLKHFENMRSEGERKKIKKKHIEEKDNRQTTYLNI